MSNARYLMEDPREAARLSAKVDADKWITKYLEPYLPAHGKVLEVGCGPGVLAIAAARRRTDLQVTGVDLSAQRFAACSASAPHNVELLQAEANHLPFPSNEYDLVYSRFLLEYLPDKLGAIREMVRVCRPGGRVLLQDLDGQLLWHYPEDEVLQEGLRCVVNGLAHHGFDPFVGRKLFSFMKAALLSNVRVSAETYHLFPGIIGKADRGLWETKLDIVLPAASKILGSDSEALRLKQLFLAYLDRDDSLTYSIAFTVVGEKSTLSPNSNQRPDEAIG